MQKAAISKPIHVDTHNQIHQRLPVLDFHSNSSNGFPTRPQTAQSINSVNSIRTSVHSRQENGHPSTAFDQDDCGTIKRQPADPLCNSLSTSTFNSNLYTQRTSNSSSMHSESSRNQTVNAEVHNASFAIASAYPKTVNFANCGDLDSDEEEHFPAPPEVHLNKQNGSTPQSIYQNGHGSQRNSQPSFASPVPPPIQNVQFRNGFQPAKPPILTPKPTLQQNFSPANLSRSSSKAPPPPKRSENTRIQTPSLMNEEHKQQMALFNELQYKIQARHNQQIDTN
ncbi:hypothetical protein M3Y97_00843100 [Aphelenchoides bicaudatus]|nr:hypothetical protein M3Y97_00843100 [Aphelenchoides bicaudatus]